MLRLFFTRLLAAVISYLLCLTVLIPAIVHSDTAYAAGRTLTLERVFTRDGNGNEKNTFSPGDSIQYSALIKNAGSQSETVSISFEGEGPREGSTKTIYSYKEDNVTIPPGVKGWYSPSTIPKDAPGGTYAVLITVISSVDGSFQDSNTFTVAASQSSPPKDKSCLPYPHGAQEPVSCDQSSVTVTSWSSNLLLCFDKDTNPAGYIMYYTTYKGWSYTDANKVNFVGWYSDWQGSKGEQTVAGPYTVTDKSVDWECGIPA
jgi:Predicted membrane protein